MTREAQIRELVDAGTEMESLKEMAERINWPISRIRKLVKNNEIVHIKIAGKIMVPTWAIEELIKSKLLLSQTINDRNNANLNTENLTVDLTNQGLSQKEANAFIRRANKIVSTIK